MQHIDTIIVGAGQAGLAASRLLTEARHEHVLLERGRVGERWRSSSWNSLRLLTPNWMARLPHWTYSGVQPDGFMAAAEVAAFLAAYGESFDAPVQSHTTIEHLRSAGNGFEVFTSRGDWHASNVVIATGWCDRPLIPHLADGLHPSIAHMTPADYRHPGQLVEGGVLIVGASATGVQLADELRSAGREVYLAVGRHARMPRRYRGKDSFWWLERIGVLDRTIDHVRSRRDARHEPSLQLVGRTRGGDVDPATLASKGVTLTGRLTAMDGVSAAFADDLHVNVAQADQRLRRVLDNIDSYIAAQGLADVPRREQLRTLECIEAPRRVNLHDARVSTVIWATGYRRKYPWLDVPALDGDGELAQQDGVSPVPGLYVLGQRFQRTRRSNFLDGVGADAVVVTRHLLSRHRPASPRRFALGQ